LEDDVIFTKNFKNKFNHIFNLIKNDKWDIFCLGRNCKSYAGFDHTCREGKFIHGKEILYPRVAGYMTFAYIIKNSCIKKLLETTFPIIKPVDVVTLEKHHDGEIKILGLVNDLATIRDMRDSDTVTIR